MRRRVVALTGVLATALGGCTYNSVTVPWNPILYTVFTGIETSSPAQTVLGTRVSVPFGGSESGTLFGVAGVQRQWFDGGHDNVLTVGLQGRRVLDASGVWVGAEGTYNNWRVSDDAENPVAHVFGVFATVGRPLGGGRVHLVGSAGWLRFGDFDKDGSLVYEGGNGWQANVGVEIQGIGSRD